MEIITGTLTADAVIAEVQGTDRKVVNFTLAVNDRYRDKKSGEYKKVSTYYNCGYWLGTGVAKLLTKGSCVTVLGRVSVNPYLGKDNTPKASLKLHADDIKIQYSKKNAEGAAVVNPADLTEPMDDLPF